MYGLTECQRVCYLPPDELDRSPTSVGIAIPGTEAWVEDEDGSVLGAGEVGELMVRGAHVMQGYWRDPEATAERLRPGPLAVGAGAASPATCSAPTRTATSTSSAAATT